MRFFQLLHAAEGLSKWPEKVLTMQRNWIGRSEGARVKFPIQGVDDSIEVFTTRIDTIFGATFIMLAPELQAPEIVAAVAERFARRFGRSPAAWSTTAAGGVRLDLDR